MDFATLISLKPTPSPKITNSQTYLPQKYFAKKKELSFKNNEFNETNRILEIMIATQRQAFYLSAAVPIFKKTTGYI